MHRFDLRTGLDFARFGLKTGMVYEGTTVVYQCFSSFQFQMNVEESVICVFEMDFKKSFCFRFNLSNDDYIISSITGKYCSVAFV